MGQVLHDGATTTAAIRRAIQHSQASLRTLVRRHDVNPKTVARWRKRSSVTDLPTGPMAPKFTVLSLEDEAVIVSGLSPRPASGALPALIGWAAWQAMRPLQRPPR